MSDKRFDQFPGISELNDNDILVGWKTDQGKNINFTMGEFVTMITKRIADNGIIAKDALGNYIKLVPDTNGIWQVVAEYGTTYPTS
jgi:hypothetical protein